jgi:hypothetical protein
MSGTTIKVSKLDAARRQLDGAIDLWFRDSDPVSIHTLVFASYGIIQDINARKGNNEFTLLGLAQRNLKPEYVEEAVRRLREAMNFFKHADRDPYGILEFNPELSAAIINLAQLGLEALGEQSSDRQTAFVLWNAFHKPHLFKEGANPITNSLSVVDIADLRQLDKRKFLEAALLGFAQGRIQT